MTTKTKSPADTLRKLRRAHDETRVTVAGLKQERNAYETESKALRLQLSARGKEFPEEFDKAGKPIEGTEAATLKEEITVRFPNGIYDIRWPDQDKLDQAVKEAHAAEHASRNFQVLNFDALTAELAEPARQALDRIEEAFQTIAAEANNYRESQEAVRELIIDTPTLDGRDLAFDARVQEWGDTARSMTAEDALAPRLSDAGRNKLDLLKINLGVNDE